MAGGTHLGSGPRLACTAGGAAVVANAVYRGTRFKGLHVSPLTDPIVEDGLVPVGGNYAIGEAPKPERVPTERVRTDPTAWEAIRGLLSWDASDLADARFLWRISRRYRPLRFVRFRTSAMRLPRWFWFAYAFLMAKAMKVPAERFARQHDQLIIVCYYHARSLGLVRAFRRQAKPVTDVQHGLIGPSHFAYANQSAWASDSRLQPTGFLAWNGSTKEFLERITGRRAEVRVFDDSRYFVPTPRTDPSRPRVLVALQWGSELPSALVEYITQASWSDWVLRMHPRDRVSASGRSDVAALRSCCHVQLEPEGLPIGASVRGVDLVLTWNSSVTSEAAMAGRRSIFWDASVRESFRSEIDAGLAECIELGAIPARIDQLLRPSAR
jgi:hypothetical protein